MRHKYPSRITNATYLRRRMRSRTGIIKKVTRNRNTIRWICEEKNFRGILTGLNEAFVINHMTKEALILQHNK